MKHPIPSKVAVSLALLCLSTIVTDALGDSMRCGQRVIGTGDRMHQVKSVCGEPDHVVRRVEYETVRRKVSVRCTDNPARLCSVTEESTRAIPFEEWTYDRGTRKLVRYLTFRESALVAIATDGYGTE